MKLFLKPWPPPPRMSGQQYLRYRLRLLAQILAWLVSAIAVVFYWGALILPLKVALIVIGIFFVPDVSSIGQIFVPYERYLKDGLRQ